LQDQSTGEVNFSKKTSFHDAETPLCSTADFHDAETPLCSTADFHDAETPLFSTFHFFPSPKTFQSASSPPFLFPKQLRPALVSFFPFHC
jgi:hypothetical protein